MKVIALYVSAALAAALIAPALITSTHEAEDGFTLARAIPNDVFLYVAEQSNPERAFLDDYWNEVFDALLESGVGDDVLALIDPLLGANQKAEFDRLRERATQLLDGVDWDKLGTKESAFAERLPPPMRIGDRGAVMMPHFVVLLRGSSEGAAKNFEGLTAILEAMAEEVNGLVGVEALAVKKLSGKDKVPVVKIVAGSPNAVVMQIAVALRDDLIIIGMGDQLMEDALSLLNGSSEKKALGDDARFKAAFARLPAAEDTMTFFDVQALLRQVRVGVDTLLGIVGAPRDVNRNSGMSAEVGRLNAGAVSASQRGDVKQALALAKQAHEADPANSIILYNMACFNALLGNSDKALAWLEKAVEAGFYAPGKIAGDTDLESLRREPKFKAALTRATELAAESYVEDIVINGAKTGEAYRLLLQVHQAYKEKDYERGLELTEQAYAVAPKHSRVLYSLACFHSLLGHEEKALDFLEEAVDGGFYCPQHLSRDVDWEDLFTHERYKAALTKAREKASALAAHKDENKMRLVRQLLDRVTRAAGVLDYSATVETTEGHAAWTESITALVPDAKERPIYPVFAKRPELTDFDRYLPQETLSFSVSSGIDLGELYKFLEDSFRGGGPLGEEILTKWDEIQKQFGIDVQKDIIGWIDGDICISVTLADDGGSVWLIQVTDEELAREKVGAAIEFCTTKLTEALGQNPALASLAMLGLRTSPVEDERFGGFQNLHIAMSPQPVAIWGVANSYLIVGTSADAVALCLATARGDHPGIRDNTQVMREAIVPSGPFTSVSLTDQRGLGEELATGLGVASMITGMMGTFVPEPQARPVLAKIAGILNKLTPVARKIDFYKSEVTLTTFDGQVWHSRGVTHYFSPAERAAKDTRQSTQ